MELTPSEIIAIVFGGKSVFTLRSTQSGQEYTYMVAEANKRNPNDPKEIPVYFVKLLTGPDNLRDYTYMGTIFNRNTFRLTSKSRVTTTTPSVIAFDWSLRSILSGKIPATLEFLPSNRCARCGRVLTVSDSILTGFGPECADKVGAAYAHVRGTVTAPKQDVPAPKQETLVNSFKVKLAKHAVPAPTYDGETLRNVASPVHEVTSTEIEDAVQRYKTNSPELYNQGGMLDEQEAHAVAVMKFQHELSLR